MKSQSSILGGQFISVFLTVILILSLSLNAFAQTNNKKIYVYKDENGNMVFTDKAQANAKQIDVKTNTMTMPATDTSVLTTDNDKVATKVKYKIQLTQPSNKQTIRNNQGKVEISATISPKLTQNYKFRLKLNGKITQKPHAIANFVLKDVDRGEHFIVIELIDEKQQVIAQSDQITFYLFRTSILHNRSQN